MPSFDNEIPKHRPSPGAAKNRLAVRIALRLFVFSAKRVYMEYKKK